MSKTPMFKPLVPKGGVPKGRRPILMAQPGAMTERASLKDQVYRYLERLRYTLPFPKQLLETYYLSMPLSVREMTEDNAFTEPQGSMRLNLLNSMNYHHEHNVVHFSLDSASDWARECGNRNMGHDKVFWAALDRPVPAAADTKQTPIHIPEDHPWRAELLAWHKAADDLEEDIQSMCKVIHLYSTRIDSVGAIRCTWPELLNFVNAGMQPLSHSARNDLKAHAAKVMAPTDKAHIIQQLSTAVMIPERSDYIAAWVGYFLPEYRQ